ncbi:MAG: YbhB/YbcL family Raf kinase inhibitor-like protein [Chitinivibrionia bacterium]|nr:YbhB/YbcL family Raf kinase inhibitor-like protein [Chitinivibrionia bacterium]
MPRQGAPGFTTLTADPVLVLLNDAQLKILSDLGTAEASLNDAYGYARFPLAKAFRRLNDGDLPAGKTGLSRDAVKAYSAYLFSIDGEMSYLRAQAYASVLGSMDATQQAKLAAMKGKGSLEWTQPTEAQVAAVLARYPGQMMRTYAGEMLAWYMGNIDADVYFCPERQGTYFGSFFMKDIKAMNNPSYTIDSNMTADMGDAFLAALNTTQKTKVTDLVTTQKADLLSIVSKRNEISALLRNLLTSGGTIDRTTVVNLARQYGELDGDISYLYATAFSSVGTSLTGDQKNTLTTLRKTATAEAGGTPDYDNLCGNGYLYSARLNNPPTVMNTDFMFGVCSAAGSTCSTNWDCCSYSCSSGVCGSSSSSSFALTSSAFVAGGTLPSQYTCDGTLGMLSHSPPLAWTGAPSGTVTFALTISTIALDGTKYNWVLYNIPNTVTSLTEATTLGTAGVSTDGPELRYYPPCSAGPGAKTYTFTLYALSGTPTFSVPVTGNVLIGTISPLILGSSQVNVTYTRTGL